MAPIGMALCFERSFRNLALEQLDFMTLVVCQVWSGDGGGGGDGGDGGGVVVMVGKGK